MESSPVCCISDIPIAHLAYQAKRYGKIAIGFHREAVVRHGFNPVFYTLHHTKVLQSIRRGFIRLRNVDADSISSAADDIASNVYGLECEHGHAVDVDIQGGIDDIQFEAYELSVAVSSAQENLERFLAFVKTFDPREFSTIYCEREWRSTETFSFSMGDVAMIVVPRGGASSSYFEDLITRRTKTLKIPRSIPIVPWEDLIEH